MNGHRFICTFDGANLIQETEETESMATGKIIGKLLKFKGFKAVDLAFKRDNQLHIAVKPFKNG